MDEEDQKLLDAFKALNIKPKADTAEELKAWLTDYGSVKEENVTEPVPKTEVKQVITSSHQPRISIFYGDTDSLTKGEVTYDQWKYEVQSLMYEKTYKQEVILQAIRRSLRGEASRILMRLGPGVSFIGILEKFESVYGVVDSKECLLAKFYSAKQKEKESVTEWSCRLEDILNKAAERGLVKHGDTNDMLRSMLWTGMRQDFKDISGYKFEMIKDFDKLRVELRKIEQYHEGQSDTKTIKTESKDVLNPSESTCKKKTEMEEVKDMIKTMSTTVTNMKQQLNEVSGVVHRQQVNVEQNSQTRPIYGTERRYGNRFNSGNVNRLPPPNAGNRQPQSMNKDMSYQQGGFKGNQHSWQGPPGGQRNTHQQQPQQQHQFQQQRGRGGERYRNRYDQATENIDPNFNMGPLCFRCRQRGHYQWECTTRLDHANRLN